MLYLNTTVLPGSNTGYEGTDEETSWILVTELGHASEIVTKFHTAYPTLPSLDLGFPNPHPGSELFLVSA